MNISVSEKPIYQILNDINHAAEDGDITWRQRDECLRALIDEGNIDKARDLLNALRRA